ncbi:MAG: AAA-like domain-containing protein [Nostoc sp. ChiSLP01]|nr:AAA-like domain-containing protein [Nostoc sp. CmiSLP01]MDZ8283996.1 AAA-like domain-containing protein [Nostoc sp. ChiSLP01]
MPSLHVTKQGKNKIRQARNFKGWIIEDSQWLIEASKVLEPNNPWTMESRFFAEGISLATWKRFLQGEAIRVEPFKAFCQVLGLNWQEICETDEECDRANVNARFEILREPQEFRCYQAILQPGSFVRIKGPQYMGKTRLLNRVLAKIQEDRQDRCHIVILDWQNDFDSTVFHNYGLFLENFCAAVSRYLGLPDNLDMYWNQRGSPNSKTTNYFCDYLLPQIENQLILVLEKMERVFEYPSITQDFCGLLRGWHGRSKRDKLWQKFNLVIVHSTDPYAAFDIQTSPLWNLGETVTLEEFTREQVNDLVRKYGLSFTHEQVAQLMEMSNGHPFLVNHALKTMAEQSLELEKILAKAATQESIYHNHLLELWTILKGSPLLKEAFKRLVTESPPVPLSPDILFKLESLGLVKVNGDCASPRCQLYHQYFANQLLENKRTS